MTAPELEYEVAEANVVRRGVQAVAASKPGAWTLSFRPAPLDELVHRAMKARRRRRLRHVLERTSHRDTKVVVLEAAA